MASAPPPHRPPPTTQETQQASSSSTSTSTSTIPNPPPCSSKYDRLSQRQLLGELKRFLPRFYGTLRLEGQVGKEGDVTPVGETPEVSSPPAHISSRSPRILTHSCPPYPSPLSSKTFLILTPTLVSSTSNSVPSCTTGTPRNPKGSGWRKRPKSVLAGIRG